MGKLILADYLHLYSSLFIGTTINCNPLGIEWKGDLVNINSCIIELPNNMFNIVTNAYPDPTVPTIVMALAANPV